jgi:hypothetical protein
MNIEPYYKKLSYELSLSSKTLGYLSIGKNKSHWLKKNVVSSEFFRKITTVFITDRANVFKVLRTR